MVCEKIVDEGYSFLSETNRYKRFLKLKIESKTFVKQAHLDSYLSIKKRSDISTNCFSQFLTNEKFLF